MKTEKEKIGIDNKFKKKNEDERHIRYQRRRSLLYISLLDIFINIRRTNICIVISVFRIIIMKMWH